MNIAQQSRELMKSVRGMVSPDELAQTRKDVDVIVARAADIGRGTMTDWADRQSASAAASYSGDRVFDFSRSLINAPDAAPLGR